MSTKRKRKPTTKPVRTREDEQADQDARRLKRNIRLQKGIRKLAHDLRRRIDAADAELLELARFLRTRLQLEDSPDDRHIDDLIRANNALEELANVRDAEGVRAGG